MFIANLELDIPCYNVMYGEACSPVVQVLWGETCITCYGPLSPSPWHGPVTRRKLWDHFLLGQYQMSEKKKFQGVMITGE